MCDMSTFNEADHPRDRGRFTHKHWSDPADGLDAPAAPAEPRPLSIAVLDEPDPRGGYDVALEAPTGLYLLKDGHLHNADGPAYTGVDGEKQWWVDGQLHNEHGPAIIHEDGSEETWVRGEPIAI